MVQNPCIDSSEDRCKFYVDKLPSRDGHCLILGRGDIAIEEVKNRSGDLITAAQIKWFLANCPEFVAQTIPECEA